MEVSPYHLVQSANAQFQDSADEGVQRLWRNLPTQYLAGQKRDSLMIREVTEGLQKIVENKASIDTQIIIMREIFSKSFEISNKQNTIEMFLLLKLLMPQQDIDNVYGIKTKRLVRLFENIIKNKFHYAEGALLLREWLTKPLPEKSFLSQGIICRPEHKIASIITSIKNMSPQQYKSGGDMTVHDLGIICASLTRTYLTGGENMDALQSEILYNACLNLGYRELEFFLRVILKKVSIGIGPKTVLQCMPHFDAATLFEKQHTLAEIANQCTKKASDPQYIWQKQPVQLVCGIPFTPMTCQVLKSPYLFKWIFSTEERLKKPISPIDGRLVVVSTTNSWYIPMKHNTQQKTYFNIENESILKNKTRREHVKWLRQFKNANKINADECEGLVIHYTLTIENKNQIVLLIRMLSNAIVQNIELYDEQHTHELRKVESMLTSSFSEINLEKENEIEEKIRAIINQKPVLDEEADGKIPEEKLVVRNIFEYGKKKKRKSLLKSTSKSQDIPEKEDKVIVQVKYDGDRIQVHVKSIDKKKIHVKLFTKNGRDVSDLYSSVRDELEKCVALAECTPCVFDGEIVVVDNAGRPLPWNNDKWKYNNKEETSENEIMGLVYDENEETENVNENRSDNVDDDTIRFIEKQNTKLISKYTEGPIKYRSVQRKECRLYVILYDLLVHNGNEMHKEPCVKRLMTLKTVYEKIFGSLKHCQVIKETYEINRTSELLKILKECVENEYEGLVLKDPFAEYEFKKSNAIQKIKIKGPDINTFVAGTGFTLSSNPRQWGFLTCVKIEDEDFPSFLGYVRNEHFEGSEPWKGFEVFMNLESKMQVSDIYNGKTFVDPKVSHCRVLDATSSYVTLVFNEKCRLTLSKTNLIDIQWLCNPLECPFSLSIRGDLWPIPKPNVLDVSNVLNIPRNPVARIELHEFQKSECDSYKTISKKYTEYKSIHSSLETHMLSEALSTLRKRFPSNDSNLQILRKVLLAFKEYRKDTGTEEKWPKSPPRVGYSLSEFNLLLSECLNKCDVPKHLFKQLTTEEKLVLGQIPTKSEWTLRLVKKEAIPIQSEEDVEEENQTMMNIEKLSRRLSTLSKNVKRPIVFHQNVQLSEEFITHDVSLKEIVNITNCQFYPYPLNITPQTSDDDEEV